MRISDWSSDVCSSDLGADLGASEAALRDAQVSLLAEVARNYFELRGTQLRLDIARRDIDNQRQTVHLTEVRQQVGTGSEQNGTSTKARLSAVQRPEERRVGEEWDRPSASRRSPNPSQPKYTTNTQ